MNSGLLTIYKLTNTAEEGDMPCNKLVSSQTAFYEEQTVGVTRSYAAIGVNEQIDALVRCFNISLDPDEKYVILEDGNQYRISLKQKTGDNVDLTLVRLEDYYDVHAED